MEITRIVIVIILVCVLAIYVYIRKHTANRIRKIIKEYPEEVSIFLHKSQPNIDNLNASDKRAIMSFPIEQWEDWALFKRQLKNVVQQYPYAVTYYIQQNLSNSTSIPVLPKKVIEPSNGYFIKRLSYDQVITMYSESSKFWEKLNNEIIQINKLIQQYPIGYTKYCDSNPNVTRDYIINDQSAIADFQELYEITAKYKDFEKKQLNFNNIYLQQRDTLKSFIVSTTKFSYQRRTENGLENAEIPITRITMDEYSYYQVDEQPPKMKELNAHISEFQSRYRYFKDFVYERIVSAVKNISQSETMLVILVNRTSLGWTQPIYKYHYRHLEETLSNEGISYCYLTDEQLSQKECQVAFIVDFISTLADPTQNIEIVYQSLKNCLPVIGYYSLIGECTNLKAGSLIAKYKKENGSDLPF